ncbi:MULTISPECIES: hypothetical protein [Rhizobium]|uniref:hypothetical protein n=1 Tax=Rhizobium TaxID=379 RepID=UPI0019583F02|nr:MULTISPECIES: hypothetical protein [Rhizobium]MBM7046515.1 hypothetical protein [Rhizobium lusitanum]
MRRYLIECVLQPEEIDNLQKIFDVIIAQPWFDLNDVNREMFAVDLIKLYQSGIVDCNILRDLATSRAIARFGREMPRTPSENEREAYERGIEAGKRHLNNRPNPYPENSTLAAAYENGLLDGQKLQ